jgi:hypothetical protein
MFGDVPYPTFGGKNEKIRTIKKKKFSGTYSGISGLRHKVDKTEILSSNATSSRRQGPQALGAAHPLGHARVHLVRFVEMV